MTTNTFISHKLVGSIVTTLTVYATEMGTGEASTLVAFSFRAANRFFSASNITRCINTRCGTICLLSVVGLKSSLSTPRAFSVFFSTKLYSSGFSRLKLNGARRPTGGLVITRGIRRLFFDAECNISGWSKTTSPTSPVTSTNFSHRLISLRWDQKLGCSSNFPVV